MPETGSLPSKGFGFESREKKFGRRRRAAIEIEIEAEFRETATGVHRQKNKDWPRRRLLTMMINFFPEKTKNDEKFLI